MTERPKHGDAIWPVQMAVFARLNAIVPQLAGGRIYDYPLQTRLQDAGQKFPYVDIGEVMAEPHDASLAGGVQQILSVHVWSRYRGQKEILGILNAIKNEFHGAELDIAGWNKSRVFWSGSMTAVADDGITQHGLIRLQITTYQQED